MSEYITDDFSRPYPGAQIKENKEERYSLTWGKEPARILPIEFLKPESHPKAWGEETWWVNNDKYCAKSLKFLAGKSFSDHYHFVKEETWICVSGELSLEYYDLSNADKLTKTINPGDVIHVPAGNPHKLTAITDAVVWEVSSRHYESDSYRIGKGDSQK